MTGNAPQPGETPRAESEPWSYPDPNTAWWRVEEERDRADALAEVAAARPRHPRRRPTSTTPAGAVPPAYGGTERAFAPEALDAHAAGAQDYTESMMPPAALVEAEQEERIERVEAAAAARAVEDATPEPEPVERDHHRRTKLRFNPPETDEGYAVSSADEARAEAADAPGTEPAAVTATVPDAATVEAVTIEAPATEAMVPADAAATVETPLPKDRGPVPEQSGLSRLGRAAAEAKRDRMENHPFWQDEAMRQRLATAGAPDDTRRGQPPVRTPPAPRGPVAGLIGLVLMALIAAFFSWVSAEPFWLAAGHGDRGVATVAQCVGSGVTQRCHGSFATADGSFSIERVTLLGVEAGARGTGTVVPARMVSPDSRQAYAGDTGLMLHLRWTLGFVLVLLCGYGIAGMTGARRLETARTRRNAVLVSLAGPVLLLLGFLAAAY